MSQPANIHVFKVTFKHPLQRPGSAPQIEKKILACNFADAERLCLKAIDDGKVEKGCTLAGLYDYGEGDLL